MKLRFALVAFVASLLFSTSAVRAEVAGGFVLGEPTGISVRIERLFVLGFGRSVFHDWMCIQGDYIFIDRMLQERLRWYLGAGALLEAGHNGGLGCRVPVGLLWPFDPKFEAFGEIAPGINLIPEVQPLLCVGIGIRYIF
jgi:hypothetical protein